TGDAVRLLRALRCPNRPLQSHRKVYETHGGDQLHRGGSKHERDRECAVQPKQRSGQHGQEAPPLRIAPPCAAAKGSLDIAKAVAALELLPGCLPPKATPVKSVTGNAQARAGVRLRFRIGHAATIAVCTDDADRDEKHEADRCHAYRDRQIRLSMTAKVVGESLQWRDVPSERDGQRDEREEEYPGAHAAAITVASLQDAHRRRPHRSSTHRRTANHWQ